MADFERLNDINQRIWEHGFTSGNLNDLETLSEDIKNGTAVFERIPYAQQSGLSKGSEVLCAASIICRGCPRTESETRQIYDTDDLFGEGRIQEYLVEKWARLSGKWIDEPESYPDERMSFMYDMGFRDAGMDYGMHLNYKTDNLYVGDLNEFNVLKGESGYHVIEADFSREVCLCNDNFHIFAATCSPRFPSEQRAQGGLFILYTTGF